MGGRQRFRTPQLHKVVAILALLWPGILGSHALFIQLLCSNKSKKCVFIGFAVCLSLITFLCVLAGLFYFSGWQWPPALQLCGCSAGAGVCLLIYGSGFQKIIFEMAR